MVKAFTVIFKPTTQYSNVFGSCGINGYVGTISSYPTKTQDMRPLLVIANNITDVATKYPDASLIEEYDVKDVVILDKIICPVVK